MAVNATEVLYLTSGLFRAVPSKAILTDLVKFNGTIDGLAASLGTSPYAVNAFPFSNAEKAKTLADNLLGSTVADKAAAVTALEGILNANGGNVGIAAAAGIRAILSDAAFADAKAQLENRVKVAAAYVDSNKGNEISTSVLDAVTKDAATVTTAIESLTGTTGGNEAGADRVLTTAQDILTGTAGNDNFRAVAGTQNGNQDQTTLNSSDIIDGAAGSDTLIVNMTGPQYVGSARIKNIETLKIGNNIGAATFDYNVNQGQNEITDVTTIVADQINTTETLVVRNILKTGDALPTLSWENEAGSVAGVFTANYRESAVSGTTEQKVNLSNVANGQLNIGGGVETLRIVSAGSGTNTLVPSANTDSTNQTVDLLSNSADGINDNGALSKVIIEGAQAFGRAAGIVASGTTNLGLTNRAVGADGGFVNETPDTSSNLISVAATVLEVDATANTGGVNIRFTPRVDGAEVSQTFKGSEAADYVEFEVGNVNAAGGKGNDTFAFLNNQFNSTFTTLDTIDGGEGTDTIQLGVNGRGVYNIDWTEFNNKKAIDVLDLRGAQNNVTLADSFVANADAGLLVRTDKIVQTSATSVANPSGGSKAEDDAQTTLNLTKLSANRAITLEGGSGSDRVIGNEASITSAAVLKGGANVANTGAARAVAADYDTLTVVDSAVLSRGDLSNISGFEGLVLVKSDTAAARTFSIELTSAFLNNNTAADSNATDINDAVFAITTGAAAGSNALTGADRVSIDVTDLFDTTTNTLKSAISGRSVDIGGIVAAVGAANVTLVYNGTSYAANAATLPAYISGAVTQASTNSAQIVTAAGLTTGAGGGSGAGAGGGAAPAAGNTFTLTAANAVLTPTASANVTPAGTMSTGNDSITGGVLTNGVFIQDASTTDTDVLTAVINANSTPNLINVERIDATFVGGNQLIVTNSTGLNEVRVDGANGQITSTLNQVASIPTVTLNSGYAGTMILDGNFANAANTQAVNVNGTATGAVLQIQDATNAPGVLETLNMVVNSNSTLTLQTNGADTITNVNVTGAGVLTLAAVAAAQVTGIISASGSTGSLSATVGATNAALTGSSQADTFTVSAAAAANRTINAGAGADVFNYATFAANAFDLVNGGDGVDTVTLSSNLAHVMTNFSNIDTVTINQGTTGATTLNLGNTVGTGSLTINASALTTAGNTFAVGFGGSAVANVGTTNTFTVNVTGGALADTIVGGQLADTITGGLGTDHIRGGAGGDTIDLSEATQSADIVYILTSAETQALGTVAITGADIITGFAVANDILEVDNGAAGATNYRSAGNTPANVTSTFDGATDDIQAAQWRAEALGATALNNAGFDGVVVLEATAAVAASNFTTQAGINAAVTAITAAYAANAVANTEMLIVVYDSQTTANAAVFRYSEGAADGGIDAAELSLVGVLTGVGLGNLDHTNFI